MKVVEIFRSVEGEGKRVGLVCTFIRLFGCNLACEYCDTPYGWQKEYAGEAQEMSIDEIVTVCKALGVKNITVTGGEPLIHRDIKELLERLFHEGFWVNVETNGSIKPSLFHSQLFYTMDFKTNASGMTKAMSLDNFKPLGNGDVIKFVVGSLEDCAQAKAWLDQLEAYWKESNTWIHPEIYFSPVFGRILPSDIVDYLIEHEMYDCHVQVQLHKVIYHPNQRGV